MDREQAEQLGLFGWIVAIFLVYPSVLGWLTWKLIEHYGWPKGWLLVGITAGLALATYHLILRTRKNEPLPK